MAGTACAAAVVVGLPALSEVANEIVYPSALTYDPLARKAWYAASFARGTAAAAEVGAARAGP